VKIKLYLAQHGEAKTKDQDQDRSLTDKGTKDSEKTAYFASEQAHISVKAIFHSGKTRSKETAEIMEAYLFPPKGMIPKEDLSPNDNPKIWANLLSQGQEDIMVVGHLPHLSKLASLLLTKSDKKVPIGFKNSGIICLQRNENSNWLLSWLMTPEILGE